MLKLFTEALGKFITARLASMPEKPVASFGLPGSVMGENAINIFLTAIAEDAELRSNEPQLERAAFGWVETKPPLRLKCTYLVSAWPVFPEGHTSALMQARLLGAAYAVIASASKLPGAFIPAPLKAAGLPAPVIAMPINAVPPPPDFWISAGCSYHAAFSFTATVSLPNAEERYDHVVEEVRIDYQIKP